MSEQTDVTDPAPAYRGFPDWFSNGYAEANFRTGLMDLAGKPGLRFLQIGAYAGDATRWLMENVLTHPSSMLVDVDTWEGSPETFMADVNFVDIKAYYDARKPARVHALQMMSWEFFAETFDVEESEKFDFVYVDGDHQARNVLDDAIGAYRVTKQGGIIAFDDYRWADPNRPGWDRPATAIDAFSSVYRDRIRLVLDGLQRWFLRIEE